MLGCAIAIRREDGGPVFFKQKRMSRNGEIFDIIKFRTMKVHADQIPQHSAQVDDPRITTATDKAYTVMRTDDTEKAEAVLAQNGIELLDEAHI